MRLFLVRHGETDWNKEGRFQGQRDTALSETGRGQARLVAAYLAAQEYDGRATVLSSQLDRALATALAIGAAGRESGVMEDGVEKAEDFREIHHGDWEGLLASEVRERWGELLGRWHSVPDSVRMPGAGGETLEDVQKRAVRGVEKLARRFDGDVILVSHDAVIKALLLRFLGSPLANFWRLRIANCSLSVVELSAGKPPCVSLVGDAHYLEPGFSRPEQKAL